MSQSSRALPLVGGRRLESTIAEFENRCLVAMYEEQIKPLPNNALIALYCEAVRLAREYVDAMKAPVSESAPIAVRGQLAEDMAREPGYNDTAFVPREQQPHLPPPKAWHVVNKDGAFARNGFSYEYSADLVTCADADWPANAPHKSIALYDSKQLRDCVSDARDD